MSIRYAAPIGALLLAAHPAHADDREDQNRDTIVVTAQRLADEAKAAIERTPGGADVVPARDFENTLAVSLRDVLALSPGVYAQPRYGQEIRLSVRGSGIGRGFHVRGLMLFQDGVPLNLADNSGDFQELDPQVFERIDVVRGGNALRLGGSTLGGAIDAITPTGRSAPGIEARIDGGSFGTLRSKLAAGFATPRGDAYIALTHDRSDGDRVHADRSSIRFNANAGIRLTDAIETRFYATVNDIDQKLPGSLTRAQALANPRQSLPANLTGDQARDIDSIRLQNRTSIDLGNARLAAGVFANAKQLYHPIFQVIDQQSFDLGAFARLDLAGNVAGVPVELALGSTARLGSVDARQYVNVAGQRGALTARARQEAQTIDIYGEVRLRPIANLSLIAGGVHSHGRREVANFLNGARSGKASFNTFSPKLGVLYEPGGALQFFANYSRSAELPGYGDLNQTPFATGGVLAPGFVDLDLQRAWTVEAGTRGTAGIAKWDVTFYRADIRGELLQFNQAPDIPASTFNAGQTRHQGIEAALDLNIARWLRLRQAYQHNDFTFRRDTQFGYNRLPVVPPHLYRAELTLGTDRASIAPVVEWVPRGAFADYANTTRAPAYALLGLRAQAIPVEGMMLFLDARNLTGEKAIGDISAVVAATPALVIYYPVGRRAIYGGARVRF